MSREVLVRRADPQDAEAVSNLIGEEIHILNRRFGEHSYEELLEYASLSVSSVTPEGELNGFATFFDSPLPLANQVSAWEEWMANNYDASGYSPHNTVWLGFFAADHLIEREIMEAIMRTTFVTMPHADQCYFLLPVTTPLFFPVKDIFTEILPSDSNLEPQYRCFTCPRDKFVPTLSVRVACVEDSDDLVPIFNAQSAVMSERYGEFFLAALIENQDEHSRTLVAEVDDTAVGLCAFTDIVDVDTLAEKFDLEPYDYLVRHVEVQERPPSSVAPSDSANLSVLSDEAGAGEGAVAEGSPGAAAAGTGEDLKRESSKANMTREMSRVSIAASAKSGTGGTGGDTAVAGMPSAEDAAAAAAGGPKPPEEEEEDSDDEYADLVAAQRAIAQAKAEAEARAAARAAAIAAGLKDPDASSSSEEETDEEDPLFASSDESIPDPHVPRHEIEEGDTESTAIAITLFCLSEVLESRSADFLEHIFLQYPDKEYLIITVPHTAAEFPLLRSFTLATPKLANDLSHSLYVIHRDSLRPDFEVRLAHPTDSLAIGNLVAGLGTQEHIISSFEDFANQVREREKEVKRKLRGIVDRDARAEMVAKGIDPDAKQRRKKKRIDFGAVLGQSQAELLKSATTVQKREPTEKDRIKEKAHARLELIHRRGPHVIQELLKEFGETTESLGLEELNQNLKVYVAEVENQVVGVCVVETHVDIGYLRANFELDDFANLDVLQPQDHCLLKYLAINPIFRRKSTTLFKMVMRDLGKCAIYYKDYPDIPIPEILLRNFVQLHPRQQFVHTGTTHDPARPDTQAPFSLMFLTNRLISEPKQNINTRIVVIGASDMSLAFMEYLLYVPYLNFTHITLISPGGLPDGDFSFLTDSHTYSSKVFAQLALDDRITVLRSRLVDIDRENKCTYLADDSVVPYDYLVIGTGLQDQTIEHLRGESTQIEGVFSLCNQSDAKNLKNYVADEFVNGSSSAIVYGSTLAAYTAIQGLIDVGVKPKRIRLIQPPPSAQYVSPFNDPHIEQSMAAVLKQLGVSEHRDLTLVNVAQEEGLLTGAEFEQGAETNHVDCELLICCANPDVDADIFRALNSNSLVYDGRLVVDSQFTTNDPFIFAAGTMVKFSRRYYQKLPMEHCNTHEVGTTLAESMLPLLDPAVPSPEKPDPQADNPPQFTRPVARGGLLPGGLHYFHIETAKVPKPIEIQRELKSYGRDLITQRNGNENYTRIHVDSFGRVESISYLGAEAIETVNLSLLVGLSETYLNRLVKRFDEGLIDDFILYFRDNWAMALFHDRFREHKDQLQAIAREAPEMRQLAAQVSEWIAEGQSIDEDKINMLRQALRQNVTSMTQAEVINYIKQNLSHLYMYYVPTEDMQFSTQAPWK
eukprot:TRINITY_DN4814_c0_g1_i1.p1 TRINITY_DN4814_c0_g1~~TRINITY_DN4814_c0_g1_i1.p1  ORF type:complete len:1375 (-),score=400.93 TRINITY_DN4814_c0_g1_i1:204-4328(-)